MTDVGINAIETVFEKLFIDEEWASKTERSFSWIGHRLQQDVSAGEVFEDDGIFLSRLIVSTTLVKEVKAPDDEVLRHLARLNRHSIGSAYTYDAVTKKIRATAIAYVHKETSVWRPEQFACFVITQLCIAEAEADFIAEKCIGKVAIAAHPTSGRRQVPDDMLGILDSHFARDGLGESRYADAFEFETIAEMTLRSSGFASLGSSRTGVAIESPFGDSTALTVLSADQLHRRAGCGLRTRTNLPIAVRPEDADRIVDVLNRAERDAYSFAMHYGAWSWADRPDSGITVSYTVFFPNSVFRAGYSMDCFYSAAKRSTWVDGFLNEKHAGANAWERLATRYGIERKDE